MPFSLKRPQRFLIFLLILVVVIYFTALNTSNGINARVVFQGSLDSNTNIVGDTHGKSEQHLNPVDGQTGTVKQKDTKGYDWVFDLFKKSVPIYKPLTTYKNGEKAKELFATDKDWIFSKRYLSNLLVVDDDTVENLKTNHAQFVEDITRDKHKYFGSESVKPSGNGIVFVGGIKFSWLALIGIEQLRILGCTLPIEVFIGDEKEYEKDFCENILPKMNARCSVLHKEIGDLSTKLDVKLSGYQFKNLAFLISRFQKLLFLDADNVPLKDPTPLFDSKVFQNHGLVVWPDAWARTTHPKWYEIAGLKVTDKVVRGPYKGSAKTLDLENDLNFHDLENTLPNPTTESGMILIDKVRHSKTLLLSLYYNLLGPNLYYSLFSQGSAGEGDKETFIASAFVLGNKFYQVKEPFRFIGYHYDGSFHSKALGQADAILDYANFQKGSHLNENNNLVAAKKAVKATVEFMHLSYPKLIPFALLNDNEIIKPDGKHIRMYLSSTKEAGYDFELRIFQILSGALCKEYDGYTPVSERLIGLRLKEYHGQNPDTFCGKLIEHTNWLEKNPEKE